MTMKDFSWQAFKETGDIDAYLLYKATEDSGEREKGCKLVKQGELSQSEGTTVSQTVC